jgi:hypothetical protein
MMLIDYVHPTSEVSYLSLKKVGRFWRYLLDNFPETIGRHRGPGELHMRRTAGRAAGTVGGAPG